VVGFHTGSGARAVFVGHGHLPREWPAFAVGARAPCAGYPRNLLVPGEITEARGTARVEWVLRAVSAAGVDAVFMANDHTAVIAPNLACFLRGLNFTEAAYAGHALRQRGTPPDTFNSGAAGYVLTRPTLDLLVRAWDAKHAACAAGDDKKWLQGNPGLVLARCLRAHGVDAADTRVGGAHRFHAFGPSRTATGTVDAWYERMHETLPFANAHPLPTGVACCDRFTVSFHYVEAAVQYALDAALRADFSGGTNADRDRWLRSHWPAKGKDLGGYEHKIPDDPAKRADVRDLLLAHLDVATPATCPGG